MRVVDPEFQSPYTHGWAISYQRELFNQATVFEAAYVGRRAEHLFGAYNVNQTEIFDNGFLEAFNVVKAGGESSLMNQLLAPHSAKPASMTGSQWVRSQYASTLTLNSVANLAQTFATRVQGGKALAELAGFGPYFFYPYPQFLGGVNVIDSNDYSRYNALQLKLERAVPRRLRLADRVHACALEGHAVVRPRFHGRGDGERAVGVEHPVRHSQPGPQLREVGLRPAALLPGHVRS